MSAVELGGPAAKAASPGRPAARLNGAGQPPSSAAVELDRVREGVRSGELTINRAREIVNGTVRCPTAVAIGYVPPSRDPAWPPVVRSAAVAAWTDLGRALDEICWVWAQWLPLERPFDRERATL